MEETVSLLIVVRLIVSPVAIKCKTEIGDLEMARSGDQEVVRFDVAVDPVHLVCLFDTQNHLGDILLRHIFIEYVFAEK